MRIVNLNVIPFDILKGVTEESELALKMLIHNNRLVDISLRGKCIRNRGLNIHNNLCHLVVECLNRLGIIGQTLTRRNNVQFSSVKLQNQTRTLDNGTISVIQLVDIQGIGDSTHDSKCLVVPKRLVDRPIVTRQDRLFIIPYHRCTRDSRTDIEKTK